MQFQINDIEDGDWALVAMSNNYKSSWILIGLTTIHSLKENPGAFKLIKDICKRNKLAQQDIISRTTKGFDLACANYVNSKINSLLNTCRKIA